MIRWILAVLLVGTPALATQDQWPALFDVKGVQSGDVLNIRGMPDAGAEVIGTLAPDATSIEVVRPNEFETWGLVNQGEISGWVSLGFLVRQPGQWLGSEPAVRRCHGTEPFWLLRMNENGTLEYVTPDRQIEGRREDTWHSQNRRDVHAFSLHATPPESSAFDGVGIVTLTQCFDGMSEREFGLRLDLLLDDTTDQQLLSGCCSLSALP